jgi:phosphate transport system substrate-binding protein
MIQGLLRRVGLFIPLALLLTIGAAAAQDSTSIRAVGSGVVLPVFQALVQGSGAKADVKTEVTGTAAGFTQFCAGKADVVASNRAISVEEDNNCASANIQYLELLVAHDILAFVGNPADTFAECVTTANLNSIFAPSSQGQITTWQLVKPENPNEPLTVVVPKANTPDAAVLDSIVSGEGIRSDAQTKDSDADIISAVAGTKGAIGVVSLGAAEAATGKVKILQVSASDATGCSQPSAETVEGRQYTAATNLYLYINRVSLDIAGLKDVLIFSVGDQAPPVISGLGLTPLAQTAYTTAKAVVEKAQTGRQFSREVSSFQIPPTAAGSVSVAGSAIAFDYLNGLATSIKTTYQNLQVDVKLNGQPAGIRSLCNGQADIVVTDRALTDEQQQNCKANNINTISINLGSDAVVLLANAKSTYLACLTTDELAKTWRAATAKDFTNWKKVSDKFSDQNMTLFAPEAGSPEADLLITKVAGAESLSRDDVQLNNDPLYRAAATANVEGALTFMNWSEYQKVLNNKQANIQLVGVDAGKGCVTPSEQTITDGSYPLAQSAQLVVNEASLTKVPVQSFLWFLASDSNFTSLQNSGFIGMSFSDLPALRDTLQKAFKTAAENAAKAAEATPSPEATGEATGQPTAEATP